MEPDRASDQQFSKLRPWRQTALAEKYRRSPPGGLQGKKQVSYLGVEFLLGRSLKLLYNLGVLEPFRQALEGWASTWKTSMSRGRTPV